MEPQQTPLAWPLALDLPTARQQYERALLVFDGVLQRNATEEMWAAWKAAALAGVQEYRARLEAPSLN